MRWNPFFNAFGATAYIGAVALITNYISSFRANTPDTVFDTMAALSLVVLSAAVMGFLFFYRPVALLIENRKHEAIIYFLQTIGIFALITVLAFVLISVL